MTKEHDYLSSALVSSSREVVDGQSKNIIPPPERESLWKAYLEKFKDPIIIVLLVVFVLSVAVALYEIFVVGKGLDLLLEPSGVLVALLLATGVGFIFEVKANKEFEILNKVKEGTPHEILPAVKKNIDEFVAEAFCDAKLSQTPSNYSKEVLNLIDKHYNLNNNDAKQLRLFNSIMKAINELKKDKEKDEYEITWWEEGGFGYPVDEEELKEWDKKQKEEKK